jgi:hypothetical protein
MHDKEKNVIEQIADTVNDFVEEVANTASDALDDAREPVAAKPDRQSVPPSEFPAPDSTATAAPVLAKKVASKKAIKSGNSSAKKCQP